MDDMELAASGGVATDAGFMFLEMLLGLNAVQ